MSEEKLTRLRAERTQLRRVFTSSANKVEQLLREGKKNEVWTKFADLADKAERLFKVDTAINDVIYDVITDEKILEDEFDKTESYRERWFSLSAQRDITLNNRADMKDDDVSVATGSTMKLARKKYKLPKLELRKFDGSVKGWITFWASFEKVHEDETFDSAEKFDYLIQCMVEGSVAKEFIDSWVPSAANYPKAIQALKQRFGREELLIELYVRELLRLVLKQASSNSIGLRSLYDQLETQLRALESLDVTRDKYSSILLPLVESALPDGTLRLWERIRARLDRQEAPNQLDELMQFLQKEVEGEERINMARESFSTLDVSNEKAGDQSGASGGKLVPTAADLVNIVPKHKKPSCIFCEKSTHESSACFIAMEMSLADIEQILTRKACCFQCMRPNHRKAECKIPVRCIICQKRHLALLCRERKPTSSKNSDRESEGAKVTTATEQNLSNIGLPNVLMQTLLVVLRGKTEVKARLLIDTGSQRTYVTKRMVEKLGYDPIREEQLVHALFGGAKSPPTVHGCFRVRAMDVNSDYACNFEALETEVICHAVPVAAQGPWLGELKRKGITLSDTQEGPIDILVGADISGKLLTGRIEVLSGGLVAVQTLLGWTLMGKVNEHVTTSSADTYISMMCTDLAPADLWKLDVLGIEDPAQSLTKEQKRQLAKERFNATVKILDSGRYEVQLPWRADHPPLQRNFHVAMMRLEQCQRKLKMSGTEKAYADLLNDWLENGIIEEVPPDDWDSGHYLPHRAVYKEGSTTPVRPVFDASAREKGHPSLNQCLEAGQPVIEQIPAILLRFRTGKIGLVSDVRRAFLQIAVSSQDRDYLRFLWRGGNGQLRIFRHARVVFGVTSSPFILQSVFDHHLEMCSQKIETGQLEIPSCVIDQLRHNFYVDNYVGSVSHDADVESFIKHARTLFSMACFDLRGWERSFQESENGELHVLGILWSPKEDELKIRVPNFDDVDPKMITKKQLLSILQRLFDPMGLTSPVTVMPKRLFQKACIEGGGWEKAIDDKAKEQIMKWISEVEVLKEIRVPRWLENYDTEGAIVTLHTFCDASQLAYAAVVYVRVEFGNTVSVRLVASKSRIAPSEKITIPRLELLAATVGARLSHNVRQALDRIITCYYWTDSSTVLTWIQKEEPWAVFVGNRVNEIRLLSERMNWRHVSGTQNPADLASRGCTPPVLVKQRWWEGPDWLHLPESQWPESQFEVSMEEVMAEKKKLVITAASVPRTFMDSKTLCQNFSDYHKIVKVVGWVIRFLFNKFSSKFKYSGPLSVPELERAEILVMKVIQDEAFSGMGDPLLKKLKPQLDKHGLIRVRTKIWARKDAEDFRAPIILPTNHVLVEKLIMHVHLRNGHVVSQGLLNQLRERYWILRGRQSIRRALKTCVRCQRVAARALDAETPPLPENRVRDAQVFEICGTDLAGPLYLRNGDKVWICIFTCAVYRCIYLDLVTSLSTESFMLAFRRFVARHGRPSIMYSDNGTNFHGLQNSLSGINWEQVQELSSVDRIQWIFNPPTAAWWGGWWERLIGVVKVCLRKVLGRASLTLEELTTVVSECAAHVNSRPITFLSEDPNDPIPITPQMFISDVRETGLPDFDRIDSTNFEVRVRRRAETMDNLRVRFRSEYLGQLNLVAAKTKSLREPKVGELVLVESNKKRYEWPLAIVEEIIPGVDGNIRVLKLRTSEGQLTRPIQRVYPLEVPLLESCTINGDCEEEGRTDPLGEDSDAGMRLDDESGATSSGTESAPGHGTEPLQDNIPSSTSDQRDVITRCGRRVKLPVRFW